MLLGLSSSTPSSAVQTAINNAAAQYNLSPSLLMAVAQVESSFNPNAVGPVTSSGAQAIGLMQLMPSTAAMYGVTGSALYDPQQNADAGAAYLSSLINQYGGNVSLALAAYNAGPTAVNNNAIPTSTQNYVNQVLSLAGNVSTTNVDTSGSTTTCTDDEGNPVDCSSTSFLGLDSNTLTIMGIAAAAGLGIWAVASR